MRNPKLKWMMTMAALCVFACMACGALAAGVTLRVFTPFADVDFAAQGYMDMITAWEEETGNVIEDYSGVVDDMWLDSMNGMIRAGEADIVVLPVNSGLTVQQLVTAGELAEATDAPVRVFKSMKEADGSVLLTPVRLYWEALYVNTDVLARYGLSKPETFEQLLTVCVTLSANGVLPIANALCEWSEIVLDCAALSGAPQEQYGTQASLDGAKDVLTTLVQVGAFGSDPWNMTDMDAESRFLAGEAGMRIDAELLSQLVPDERKDCVEVTALPAKDGKTRGAVVGTPTFGAAITRACWQDDARCEAAVSFLGALLAEKSLATPAGGALGESIAALTTGAQDTTGILYDMNPDGYDAWAESVIAQLMGL